MQKEGIGTSSIGFCLLLILKSRSTTFLSESFKNLTKETRFGLD